MEISRAVLRGTSVVPGVLPIHDSLSGSVPTGAPSMAGFAKRVRSSGRIMGLSASFSDAGHLKYYSPPVRCGGGKCKEEKKKAKLVKGLSKDLAALCSMGIGVGTNQGLAGEVKGKTFTEVAEILMEELKQLRSQEKEMKRKKKEKKAAMKAAMKKDCNESSTSSSSSESSDSDCDGEIVNMNGLKNSVVVHETETGSLSIAPSVPPKSAEETEHHNPQKSLQESGNCSFVAPIGGCNSLKSIATEMAVNKIEVCMGGKCKRSGALELMEEFNKKIGSEGAVVGCKCMGKCKEGPNVRVLNHSDEAIAPKRNSLCIGVGLEDVGAIVANFFAEKDASLVAA
ncbi:diacylglycerol O-acyltransferase 3-like [Zingiber officinale]|uniref:Diacylglycerol O-acyltransferase 3, cytosolic n=1 Tax=Zingiber officinale TaxID=94328 RepID=A0A8J5FT57_ZINOF|nr:diacylglycerol O-acyltransferase 3-like [Zingiber officinale]KAG6485156.1 hypothetical protein ZIOFF_053685 [Zingiber officinale]